MINAIGNGVTIAGRAGFLALIVYAAAAYGITRAPTVPVFANLLLAVFAVRIVGAVLSRTVPRVAPLAVFLAGLIAASGWVVVGLGAAAGRFLNDDWTGPEWLVDSSIMLGTMYPELAVPGVILASALLCGFLMAIDLWNHASWSRAMVITLAITGIGVVALFYLQRTIGDPFLLRSMDGRSTLNFGTYRYWGNGASFLNLMWPLIFAVGIHLGLRKNWVWSIWISLGLVVFAANFFNVSKAGNLLAMVGVVGFLILVGLRSIRLGSKMEWTLSPSMIVAGAVPVLAIGVSLWFLVPWDRWERFQLVTIDELEAFPGRDVDEVNDARLIGYAHFESIARESGWLGFGVGSYREALLEMIDDDRLRELPFWVAHQDYFQTVIEWGYLGTALWGILILVASVRLLFRSFAARQRTEGSTYSGYETDEFLSPQERIAKLFAQMPGGDSASLQAAALTSIVLTGLHATVDFPMQVPSLQLYFLIWIALGWKRSRGSYPSQPEGNLAS